MRKGIFVVFAGALVAASGCRTPHVPTHYELAEKALREGNKELALSEFEQAVALEPEHKHAWLHIGYLKAEKEGGRDHTKATRDAILTFLMLETYEIGNVAGDAEMELPETPEEPHLARRMVRNLAAIIQAIDKIDDLGALVYSIWLETPGDEELKRIALEAQQAVVEANKGVAPNAYYRMGEILRRSGDEAGAKGHYDTAVGQALALGRHHRKAQIGQALTGGDLEAGWLAVREEDGLDGYLAFAEVAIARNQLDRAKYALTEARKSHADIRVYRKLAEVHLLLNETANAGNILRVLEHWPRRDKQVEGFLRVSWAALSGGDVSEWLKKHEKVSGAMTDFNPDRIVAHVEASDKASGEAKTAVKKAASRLTGEK